MADPNNDALARQLRSLTSEVSALVGFLQKDNGVDSQKRDVEDYRAKVANDKKQKEILLNSANEYSRKIGALLKDTGASNTIMENSIQDMVDAYAKEHKEWELRGKSYDLGAKIMERHNFSIIDASQSAEEFGQSLADIREEARGLGDELGDQTKSLKQKLKDFGTNIKNAADSALAITATRGIVDQFATSARTGVEWNLKEAWTSKQLGMSQVALMEMNGEYLQVAGASAQTTKEFSSSLVDGSWEMLNFIGSLSDAAKYTAENKKLAKLSGAATEEQIQQFTSSMDNTFQKMNTEFGVTSQKFNELNNAMYNNASMHRLMYKQNKEERMQTMKGMAARRLELMRMGMLAEQADALLSQVADVQGGKTEKERQVDAANMASLMGAMGMGEDAMRMRELMTKGPNGQTDEEKKEFQQLLMKADEVFAQRSGDGNAGMRMVTDEMGKKLTDLIGPDSIASALRTQSELEQKQREDFESKSNTGKLLTQLVVGSKNMFDSIFTDDMTKSVYLGTLAALQTAKLTDKLFSWASAGFGRISEIFTGARGRITRLAGTIASGSTRIFTSMAGSVTSMAASIAASARGLFDVIRLGALVVGRTIMTAFMPAVAAIGAAIAPFVLPALALAAAFYVGYKAGQKFNDWLNKMNFSLYDTVQNIKSWFSNLPSRMSGWLGSLTAVFKDWIRGLTKWVRNPIDSAKEAVGGWFGGGDKNDDTTSLAPVKNAASALESAASKLQPSPEEKKAMEAAKGDQAMLRKVLDQMQERLNKQDVASRLITDALERQTEVTKENTDKTVNAIADSLNGMPAR